MHATLVLVLACSLPAGFDDLFTGKTLRFDYYHSGSATEEHISLDELRLEGDWPGSRARLLDDTNLGKYLFVVTDAATNLPIYTRGFASIYGEWETTGEAKEIWRTFHESQRFPEPKAKAQVSLRKRAADGSFREIYSEVVDPASRFVNRSPLGGADATVWPVLESGPAAGKVDLLVLGG